MLGTTLFVFTQHQFMAEQTVNRKMHHYWMIVNGPLQQVLRFAIQRCSVYSTILMLIQESSGERRVKQQCMFLIRLGDEGSDFMSCFLPVDMPERHEFLCRQSCHRAHPYSSVDPRNHNFTSVQLIGSNSSSFQTASKNEEKKEKKVTRVGSR